MRLEPVTITANGQQKDVKLPCSVADFIGSRGWKPTQVVVEHNGIVVGRECLGRVMLQDGDRLEIIVPVAGG